MTGRQSTCLLLGTKLNARNFFNAKHFALREVGFFFSSSLLSALLNGKVQALGEVGNRPLSLAIGSANEGERARQSNPRSMLLPMVQLVAPTSFFVSNCHNRSTRTVGCGFSPHIWPLTTTDHVQPSMLSTSLVHLSEFHIRSKTCSMPLLLVGIK